MYVCVCELMLGQLYYIFIFQKTCLHTQIQIHFHTPSSSLSFVIFEERLNSSSKSSGLSFTLHQGESVTLSDSTLNVSDKLSGLTAVGVDQRDSDLGNTTSGSGLAEEIKDLGVDGSVFHFCVLRKFIRG